MRARAPEIVLEDRYNIGPQIWSEGNILAHVGLDIASGEPVTIFLFPRARVASPASLAVFKQIGRALQRVSHPSLLEVLSAGVHQATGYVVAADLEGVPIARSGKEPSAATYHAIGPAYAGLLSGLEAAHAAAFFHGRLIADRIYFDGEHAVLVGLGLAQLQRALERGTRLVAPGDAERMSADRAAIAAPPLVATQPWSKAQPQPTPMRRTQPPPPPRASQPPMAPLAHQQPPVWRSSQPVTPKIGDARPQSFPPKKSSAPPPARQSFAPQQQNVQPAQPMRQQTRPSITPAPKTPSFAPPPVAIAQPKPRRPQTRPSLQAVGRKIPPAASLPIGAAKRRVVIEEDDLEDEIALIKRGAVRRFFESIFGAPRANRYDLP